MKFEAQGLERRVVASGVQYLQRDVSLRLGQRRPEAIECLEDRSLAAGSEFFLQDVSVTQNEADRRRR